MSAVPTRVSVIDITSDGVRFGDRVVAWPIEVDARVQALGPGLDTVERGTRQLTWPSLGLVAKCLHDPAVASQVEISLLESGRRWYGTGDFTGALLIDGAPYPLALPRPDGLGQSATRTVGRMLVTRSVGTTADGAAYDALTLQPGAPTQDEIDAASAPVTDALVFADLNFKLLVIEELMYGQQVLLPEFDAESYLETHVDREIDLDGEEAYAPIPELLAYFDALPISASLAPLVRGLSYDGGNEVYGHIAPGWDGEEPYFDVARWDDVALFPNLTHIESNIVSDEDAAALAARGIQVE